MIWCSKSDGDGVNPALVGEVAPGEIDEGVALQPCAQ